MSSRPLGRLIKTPLGFYFYETNRNEILRISKDLFLLIKCMQEKGKECVSGANPEAMRQYEDLSECGYLSSAHVKQIEHPLSNLSEHLLARGLEKMTLQVTQNCNLRCKYCIYSEVSNLSQRSHNENAMSFETAKNAIDFFWVHSRDKKQVAIGFYGGEPLLEFQLIKDAVSYAKKIFEGKDLSFHITTNATLMTDEMTDFMLNNRFMITYSLDGIKRVQDANRIFPNGKGTYDIVIRNIERAFEQDPRCLKNHSLSMVLSPDLSYADVTGLFKERVLSNLDANINAMEIDNMSVPSSSDYITNYNYDRFLSFVELFRGNGEKYPNKIFARDMLDMTTYDRYIGTNVLPTIAAPGGPCLPGKARLFVDCFGNFYPCEKVNEQKTLQIGPLSAGFDFEQINNLLNIAKITEDLCKGCWAFSLCSSCVKTSFGSCGFSPENRIRSCNQVKQSAINKIMQYIIRFENDEHERLRRISK